MSYLQKSTGSTLCTIPSASFGHTLLALYKLQNLIFSCFLPNSLMNLADHWAFKPLVIVCWLNSYSYKWSVEIILSVIRCHACCGHKIYFKYNKNVHANPGEHLMYITSQVLQSWQSVRIFVQIELILKWRKIALLLYIVFVACYEWETSVINVRQSWE